MRLCFSKRYFLTIQRILLYRSSRSSSEQHISIWGMFSSAHDWGLMGYASPCCGQLPFGNGVVTVELGIDLATIAPGQIGRSRIGTWLVS